MVAVKFSGKVKWICEAAGRAGAWGHYLKETLHFLRDRDVGDGEREAQDVCEPKVNEVTASLQLTQLKQGRQVNTRPTTEREEERAKEREREGWMEEEEKRELANQLILLMSSDQTDSKIPLTWRGDFLREILVERRLTCVCVAGPWSRRFLKAADWSGWSTFCSEPQRNLT